MVLLALTLALEDKDKPETEMVEYNLVYLVSNVFALSTSPEQYVGAMCGQQQISTIIGIIRTPTPDFHT